MRLFTGKRVSVESSMEISHLSFSARSLDPSERNIPVYQPTERGKSKESIKSNEMMSNFVIESTQDFQDLLPVRKQKEKRSLFANLHQNRPKLIKPREEKKSKNQEKEASLKRFENKVEVLKTKLDRLKKYVSPEKKPSEEPKNGKGVSSRQKNQLNLVGEANKN